MSERENGAQSAEKGLHPCCACCEDVAKDDHVEHGGTIEKDGHDLPCLTCGDEDPIRLRLAKAWAEGLAASYVHPEPPNPYATRVLPPEGGAA